MIRWVILPVLLLSLAACAPPGSVPTTVLPRLDSTSIFPELQTEQARGEDERDEALAALARTTDSGAAGTTGQGEPAGVVALGGGLVTDLPSGDWSWAHDGKGTMLVHGVRGQPDVLVYTEAIGTTWRRRPSVEARRFHRTVDPGLGRPLWRPSLGATLALEELAGVEGDALSDALTESASRTGGLGLGYRSAPDTFTGWAWYGRNLHDVVLNLGQTQGTWGGEPEVDAGVSKARTWLSEQFPDEPALKPPTASAAPAGPTRQARQLLGTATTGQGVGIHIAVFCEMGPECRQARALARLLDRIRPGRTSATGTTSMVALASSAGAPLLPDEVVLPASELDDWMERVEDRLEDLSEEAGDDDDSAAGVPVTPEQETAPSTPAPATPPP